MNEMTDVQDRDDC